MEKHITLFHQKLLDLEPLHYTLRHIGLAYKLVSQNVVEPPSPNYIYGIAICITSSAYSDELF